LHHVGRADRALAYATLRPALKYAVREKRLSANPLDGAGIDREWKAPEVDHAVDRRRVASPAQMRVLLDAIRATGKSQGARLVALYGCMYYGMLRPSEAVSLLAGECELPAEGWVLLEFREVRSAAGREWTDDGEVHEARMPKGGPRNAVRRAVAFIDENAHIDITVVDIAAAAFVTIRAVQTAFRRHLDTTPMAYLRRVRLDHAHRELLAANPAHETVTAVAYRWGFPNPARFAAYYRQAYGVPPSRTLRHD
jgi:AraC-like DNA-binding protein